MNARPPQRPRDDLGRPLPPDSDVAIEPDPQALPAAQTLVVAQQLLDDGRAFRAHEVFEARWKSVTGAERDLWRGLAQVAVAITHAQRGNDRGRVSLLTRAAATLAPWQDERPYDVDVRAIRSWALAGCSGEQTVAQLLSSLPRLVSGGG